jgi:hypothetical protein
VFHDIAQRCASYLNIPPDANPPQPGSPPAIIASSQMRDNLQTP